MERKDEEKKYADEEEIKTEEGKKNGSDERNDKQK